MRIEGKVIVITGGASGLGLAAARYLVQEKGARVAIFDLNAEAGDKAVNDVGAEHAMFVPTDVSNEESVQIAVAAVVSRFGAIHVCINCAALPLPSGRFFKRLPSVAAQRFQTSETEVEVSSFSNPGAGRLSRV